MGLDAVVMQSVCWAQTRKEISTLLPVRTKKKKSVQTADWPARPVKLEESVCAVWDDMMNLCHAQSITFQSTMETKTLHTYLNTNTTAMTFMSQRASCFLIYSILLNSYEGLFNTIHFLSDENIHENCYRLYFCYQGGYMKNVTDSYGSHSTDVRGYIQWVKGGKPALQRNWIFIVNQHPQFSYLLPTVS